jgi:hypothetical protein
MLQEWSLVTKVATLSFFHRFLASQVSTDKITYYMYISTSTHVQCRIKSFSMYCIFIQISAWQIERKYYPFCNLSINPSGPQNTSVAYFSPNSIFKNLRCPLKVQRINSRTTTVTPPHTLVTLCINDTQWQLPVLTIRGVVDSPLVDIWSWISPRIPIQK